MRPDHDKTRANHFGHALPFAHELRDDSGEGNGIHAGELESVFAEIAEQAHVYLVFGEGAVGGHAPGMQELVAVKQAEGGLRVTRVDG